MSAILKSLNTHSFLIFQPISMTLVSKFMVYRALSDKTYLLLGLQSTLKLKKADAKIMFAKLKKKFSSYCITLKIQRVEGSRCRSR